MSRNHGTIASEINHTIHSVQNMNPDEAERIYGVVVSEDGAVFDSTYNMKFDGLSEWATFCVEQDHEESYESITEFEGWG